MADDQTTSICGRASVASASRLEAADLVVVDADAVAALEIVDQRLRLRAVGGAENAHTIAAACRRSDGRDARSRAAANRCGDHGAEDAAAAVHVVCLLAASRD
jgi:hypothetical protein